MAMRTKGDLGLEPQVGATVQYNDDGSATGTAVYITDVNSSGLLPSEGSVHPKDPRLTCTNAVFTYLNNNRISSTCTYFGLTSTKRRISYSSGTTSERIETYVDFEELAGSDPYDKSTWRNGAVFRKQEANDEYTEKFAEFLGFFPSNGAPIDLAGVTEYLNPSGTVEVSYYLDRVPSLSRLMQIHSSVTGFRKPEGVKDLLLIDMPYRQIGDIYYQVSEVYLCSGKNGWSNKIYK